MGRLVHGEIAFASEGVRAELAPDRRGQLERHLAEHGYAYLRLVPEGFDHVALLEGFGDLMPQYDGKTVWDLKPEPGMDDVYHSRNTRALLPHTEAYEYTGLPPRYIALWCLQPADVGGETTLADGARLLAGFDAADRAAMRTRRYRWFSSEGLARRNIRLESVHPILQEHAGAQLLRYSANNVVSVEDGLLPRYIESGLRFFEREHVAIRIERNALLLWDNWRMLHSRTAFRDRGRHLKRVLISA